MVLAAGSVPMRQACPSNCLTTWALAVLMRLCANPAIRQTPKMFAPVATLTFENFCCTPMSFLNVSDIRQPTDVPLLAFSPVC